LELSRTEKQYIDIADLIPLLIGKPMAQVAIVTDPQSVHLKAQDAIFTDYFSPAMIMESGDSFELYALNVYGALSLNFHYGPPSLVHWPRYGKSDLQRDILGFSFNL
jgi:hypothetical protein